MQLIEKIIFKTHQPSNKKSKKKVKIEQSLKRNDMKEKKRTTLSNSNFMNPFWIYQTFQSTSERRTSKNYP